MEHILFKEDLADPALLQAKLLIPATAPSNDDICPEVQRLNLVLEARLIGLGSFITNKTPQEGFTALQKTLEQISKEYTKDLGNFPEKVFRMGPHQNAIFASGLQNYCNFGGHGCGVYLVR